MKHPVFSVSLTALIMTCVLIACGGAPKQSKCSVEVYSPEKKYTEAVLLDSKGAVIDSTLRVANDSIRFERNDTASMPYVATLRLHNPSDSLDVVLMPIVIEGGTVCLELTDRIDLSGTDDNEKLFKFLKAKNSFTSKYENEGHDVNKLKEDYSRFFADQIILYKGSVVSDYISATYGSFLTREDNDRVKERMK